MADISAIKLPNSTTYNVKDNNALYNLTFSGGTLTQTKRNGQVTPIEIDEFDSLDVTELNAGNMVVTGNANFTNGLYGDLTGTVTGDVNGNATSATTAVSATTATTADSAGRIGTVNSGSNLNPVYFSGGLPLATTGTTLPVVIGGGATGAWTGELPGVSEYYDGLTILFKSGYAGASTTTLNLNNLGAKTVYTHNGYKLTTHYAVGSHILLVYNTTLNSGCWMCVDNYWADANTVPTAYCSTAAATAAKAATCTNYALLTNSYNMVLMVYSNTVKGAITLNINSKGAKPIYINGAPSSSTNYTLPAGTYFVFYDGTNYYFRTDGKITGSITGTATLETSGVTSGTYGPSADIVADNGSTISVPNFAVDTFGRVTSASNKTLTINCKTISSITWYYLLQAENLTPPTKPSTVDPGSSWSTVEPTYTEGSHDSLYITQLTVFSDNTFSYSDVSLSQSYEVAKDAYEKALEAKAATEPIMSKTYSGLIGTANNFDGANFFFGNIYPTDYNATWRVKLRITVTLPTTHAQVVDIEFGGYSSAFSSYDAYVSRASYSGIYYVELFNATQAGFNNGVGHMMGISLQSSGNPITAGYERTMTVDLISTYNCTAVLNDTAVKYTEMDGYNTTNYGSGTTKLTQMTVYSQGQNATNNVGSDTIGEYGAYVTAGTNGIKQYSLIMEDATGGTWSSFTTTYGTGTSKTKYTGGFRLGKILKLTSSSNIASGSQITVWDCGANDLRCSTNCGTTLVAGKPVYIVGTVANDGLFYLDDTWWTQTEPTTDNGKTYIYVGHAYSTYQIYFTVNNPIMRYYNGEFLTIEEIEIRKRLPIAGGTITGDLSVEGDLTGVDGDFAALTVDDVSATNLLVTGTANFSNGLYGNLSGNAATATTATTASSFTSDRTIALTGAVLGSVASNGANGWTINTTLYDVVDNLTTQDATKALTANQGYILANGSARDSTKLPLTGGTISGDLLVQGDFTGTDGEFNSLDITDLEAGNLVVNGRASFANGAYGDLFGNADSATTLEAFSHEYVTVDSDNHTEYGNIWETTGNIYNALSKLTTNTLTIDTHNLQIKMESSYTDNSNALTKSITHYMSSGLETYMEVGGSITDTVTIYPTYIEVENNTYNYSSKLSSQRLMFKGYNGIGFISNQIVIGDSNYTSSNITGDISLVGNVSATKMYEGFVNVATKYQTLQEVTSAINNKTKYLNYVSFNSSSPGVVPNVTGALNSYKSWILIGFVQNIGSVSLALTYSGSTLTARNLMTGTAFSNAALTFSVSGGALTINSNATGGSVLLVITV